MVKCFNDKKCHGYHEHCDPHLPHCGEDCACCTVEPFCGERDILSSCPVPVCPCNPCWDNCRCTKEIKKLQAKTDEIENKTENFDGRVTKVEKDIVDFNRNLTQQIGDLAEKEQSDVDNLQGQIDTLTGNLDSEIERATAAEGALDAKINKEITDRIADVNAEEQRASAAEQNLNNKIDTEIANRKADAVSSAEYNKNDVKIYLKNKDGQTISTIDARDFIVDGMVSRVYINNRELVIDWNADAGIQTTRIPLDLIFNPDNYYTKADINLKIADVNDRINTSNQNISNVSNRVDQLSATVAGHTTSISNLNNIVSENTTRINNLSQQITNYGPQINDLLGRVAALEQLWYNNNGVITAVGGKPVLTTGTSTAAGFYDSLINA